MPTYRYLCKKCNTEFEEFQSITATPSAKCLSCDEISTTRLINSKGNFILKGGGWSLTGYSKWSEGLPEEPDDD